MANLWLDLKGPILADTVYVDGVLAAKDVTIALPPVNLVTADFKAMGTYTAPLPGQIEAMEASITKIGIDLGLRSLVKLTSKTIEIRWAQDVKLSDGSTKTEGCKAFLRCVSKGIPGLNVDPGNASENEIALAVSRYQLFVAGNEYWLIDQLNTIMRRRLRQGHPQRPVTRRASPPGGALYLSKGDTHGKADTPEPHHHQRQKGQDSDL